MRGEPPTHRPPSMKRQPPIPRPANPSAAESASQGGQSISAYFSYSAVASEARTGHPHRQNFTKSLLFLYRLPKTLPMPCVCAVFLPIFRIFHPVLRVQIPAFQLLATIAVKKCKKNNLVLAIPRNSSPFASVRCGRAFALCPSPLLRVSAPAPPQLPKSALECPTRRTLGEAGLSLSTINHQLL